MRNIIQLLNDALEKDDATAHQDALPLCTGGVDTSADRCRSWREDVPAWR
ncbi:hypothetical protein [Streptomyces flavovirens]